MSETDAQLTRVEVSYDSETDLDDDGYSFSRETTTWRGIAATADGEDRLAVGCHRAALAYPDYVSRLLFGLIGVSASGEDQVEPAFYVWPVGPKIIEMGALARGEEGELFYPVTGGLLAVIHSENKWDAKLSFRWWRDGDREIFETRLVGFRPAISGRRTRGLLARARALTYRFTQTRLHAFVMWMFHRWVRKRRAELLRSHRQIN